MRPYSPFNLLQLVSGTERIPSPLPLVATGARGDQPTVLLDGDFHVFGDGAASLVALRQV